LRFVAERALIDLMTRRRAFRDDFEKKVLALLIPAALLVAACGSSAPSSAPPTNNGPCAGPCPASRIKHLVVVIQENTSFDVEFAHYCKAKPGSNPTCDDGPNCCETGPAVDAGSGDAPVLLTDAAHAAFDPNHTQACELADMDGGKMDAYVTNATCGNVKNFAYYDPAVSKPYYDLAASGAIADHWFQPVAGQSSSNDMYFARANFVFLDNSAEPDSIGAECPERTNLNHYSDTTIGDLLADANVPWAFYIEGYQAMKAAVAKGTCPAPDPACPLGLAIYPCVYDPGDIPFQYYPRFRDDPEYMRDFSALASDLQSGSLPAVSFVKALGFKTEHPGYGTTISAGVKFVTDLVNTIESSSYANSTLILITYDESGGFSDHVKPPPKSPVDDEPYGPRVPLIAVGPFARKDYVSHVVLEHSSIVKFIEWNWLDEKTGQLGTRDAVVNDIGSLLDTTQTGVAVPE
jgi:phospholipase C